MTDLTKIYSLRFGRTGLENRVRVWEVLCKSYFQQFVHGDAAVLDIGCGYGEFINSIQARRRLGIDLNPEAASHLASNVEFKLTPADNLSHIENESIDLAFASNFLEHLPDKNAFSKVVREVHRVLKVGGKFMIMGPNIRYTYKVYWDFFDHHLPLSHLSLLEGLCLEGYEPEVVIDRFLPYTMANGQPPENWMIRAYLKLPLVWKLFGKQFLVIARKPAA